jgi:hypothetical protein
MHSEILRLNGAVPRDAGVAAWFKARPDELGRIALRWFGTLRDCGDDVLELVHDGCPVACVEDAPFAYVNVFKAHVNVGFFQGTALPDPAQLLQGEGKRMRHVKLRPGEPVNFVALDGLVRAAYADVHKRLNRPR